MLTSLETPRAGAPRRVKVPAAVRHHTLLETPDGTWVGMTDGGLTVQSHVDDAAIWDAVDGGFRHALTGFELDQGPAEIDGSSVAFAPMHGPERLPSDYLTELCEHGWVCLTSILASDVVDGLQQVGCVGPYADHDPRSETALAQHRGVADAMAEPVSLWLARQHMRVADVRLGHAPHVRALPPDDGKREVQGWHSDYPYLWGTATAAKRPQIPQASSELVLGLQRVYCVSPFTFESGATLYKLGSHLWNQGPPHSWGVTTETMVPGYRESQGLPYSGADADVVEAPGGSIMMFDTRMWHRAGLNRSTEKRGSIVDPLIPAFLMPFRDTSGPYKEFMASDVYRELTPRVRRELEALLVHRIDGVGGTVAIGTDVELSRRLQNG